MKVLVTGSGGLIGSECVEFFCSRGFEVIGVDNDKRSYFFGSDASTRPRIELLIKKFKNYTHFWNDIRDSNIIWDIFINNQISLVIHTAAQPSHDWAAKEAYTDFSINASATHNLLEACRHNSPDAVFIFTSTNKVYGDTPNTLPLVEMNTRWEVDTTNSYFANGIDECMSIDHSTHSLFGISKLSADLMVQEYGRYFGMNTVCFRCGCLTGPNHAGAKLHGFLAYLMDCGVNGREYTIYGYKGKQVRDNIHSSDLVNMFWEFFLNPKSGAVYNAGGGRLSNCSILEAIDMCQEIIGREFNYKYIDVPRRGDHIWWISNTNKFRRDYPNWLQHYDLSEILQQLYLRYEV